MAAIAKPHRVAVLVPEVKIDGPDAAYEREAAVLAAVTGKTTLSKLVAQLSGSGAADPEEVLRAVFLGLSCELLRSSQWVVPPSFIK